MSLKDVSKIWQKAEGAEKAISKEYTATFIELELAIRSFFATTNVSKDLSTIERRQFKLLLDDANSLASEIGDKAFKFKIQSLLRRSRVNSVIKFDTTIEYYIGLLTKTIVDNIDDLLDNSVDDSYKVGLKLLKTEKERQMSNTAKNEIISSMPFGASYSEFIKKRHSTLTHNIITEAKRNIQSKRKLTATLMRTQKQVRKQRNYTKLSLIQNTSHIVNSSILQAMKDEDHEKYIIRAVMDNRTTQICRYMNGKVFYVKDAVVGDNMPPFYDPPHPCRSIVEPYFGAIDE